MKKTKEEQMDKIDRLTLIIQEALTSSNAAKELAATQLPSGNHLVPYMRGKAVAYADVLRLIEELESDGDED